MRKSDQRKEKEALENTVFREASVADAAEGKNREGGTFFQGAVSVFILFHLIAITCWSVPTHSSLVMGVKDLVGPYMQWTALSQSWDMFAPDPRPVNTYIRAVIITQNRHIHVWTFPRMEQLSFGERYRKERYRKFAENLVAAKNAAILPDVARHLASMYKDPADPPAKVLLVQFQAPITPGANEAYNPVPKPTVFYDGYIAPADLR